VDNYNQMNFYQDQSSYQPEQIKNLCEKYMNYHVIVQLSDGSQFDGIIDGMDEESVIMLVPEEIDGGQTNRQYGFDYDDDNGYDYDEYGRPRRRRFRRFRRRRFPFPFLRRLFRYPYYYPIYPQYPPYPYGYGGGY
jgi:small nuclear ribonucleoprotein (snRNP)-like protein